MWLTKAGLALHTNKIVNNKSKSTPQARLRGAFVFIGKISLSLYKLSARWSKPPKEYGTLCVPLMDEIWQRRILPTV